MLNPMHKSFGYIDLHIISIVLHDFQSTKIDRKYGMTRQKSFGCIDLLIIIITHSALLFSFFFYGHRMPIEKDHDRASIDR
jgi:hypothetical protein